MSQCIFCKSNQHEKWISFKDIFEDTYHLHQCKNCGVYFLNPIPTVEQLKRAYDESYYGLGEKKFNPTVEKVVDFFRQRTAKNFAKNLAVGSKVLDIGCGNGSFLANLGKQKELELHGLELDGKSADRASMHSQINLHRGFLEWDTYPENYFDAIIMTHVFEHLPNPKEIIEIIHRIAKKGAVLQIEIPNIASWQAQLFKSYWFHLDPPRHLNFFPSKVLQNELSKLGWSIENERYFSPQFSPFGVQQSILNRLLSKREVLYEYLKGNKTYVAPYSMSSLTIQKLFHWLTFPFFILTDALASMFEKGGTLRIIFKKN